MLSQRCSTLLSREVLRVNLIERDSSRMSHERHRVQWATRTTNTRPARLISPRIV